MLLNSQLMVLILKLSPLTRVSEFVTRGFELLTCRLKLATRRFEVVTCKFELVARVSKLVTRNS